MKTRFYIDPETGPPISTNTGSPKRKPRRSCSTLGKTDPGIEVPGSQSVKHELGDTFASFMFRTLSRIVSSLLPVTNYEENH